MTTAAINIDELLTTIQSGRRDTKQFKDATIDLMILADTADAKNEPERTKRRAAAKANGQSDLTPTWGSVLNYYIDGIRSKRNSQSLRDELVQNLREMAEYATAE